MPDLNWDDSYSVGVPAVDDEHKRLVALINKAHGAFTGGGGKDAVAEILEDMNVYAATHFRTEEKLMAKHAYPATDEHKAQHRFFTAKAQRLSAVLRSNDTASDPFHLFQFLSQWLIDHIQGADKRLGDFLHEKTPS